jgi:alpha-tubulin suppressor-like RCC1 family protein
MTNIGLPLTNVKAIEENDYKSYGYRHTCAIAGTAKNAWCWGENRYGQLGDQSYTDRTSAVVVYKSGGGLLTNITQISLGHTHTCGIDTSRQVWCWGENDEGQLGINSTVESVTIATKVRTASGGILRNAKNIVSTYNNTCAHLTNNQVWCWGDGYTCIISCYEYYYNYTAATKHPYANGSQTIYAGYGNMCALKSGYLQCWGDNSSGQLANWSTTSTNYPTYAQLGNGQYMQGGITDVSIGDGFICAVRSTMVYCAGSNYYNRSGSGLNWYGDCDYWSGCANQHAYLPLRTVEGQDIVNNVVNLESGRYSSCFVARNGSVWCWGYGWTDQKPTRVKYADGTYMGS